MSAPAAVHVCHAQGCPAGVRAQDFMCQPHWLLVPAPLRDVIAANHRAGHENDTTASPEYRAVAQAAVDAVAHKEARSAPRAARPRRGKPVQLALFDLA